MLQRQIKIYASRILTVVMCYHIIGYAVLFRVTDLVHRSVMEEFLNKRELTILKIPNEYLKHHPKIFIRLNRREIVFKNNYYDVREELQNDSYTEFRCLKDVGENDWHQKLSEAQDNSNANHSDGKTLKSNMKIFSPKWFSTYTFQFLERNSSQLSFVFGHENISNVRMKILLPPPKV